MCGIAGFSLGSVRDPDGTARALASALAHRGPDGTTSRAGESHVLVHTRLAVVDLSERVVYPLANEAGDVFLAFNGEIYNHRILREELERRGHRFATECDAEAVLHGYEEWGDEVFGRLSGMFAVAIDDTRRGELILARDRFGIKPLVRTARAPFAFSSDAMSLVSAGLVPGDVDEEAVAEYSLFHYVPPPRTGIRHVAHVEPGTVIRRSVSGAQEIRRWAPKPFDGAATPGPAVSDHDLELALRAAVERHLMADVPVGVLLSAGTDSRLVAAFAADAGARPTAFTLGFPGAGSYDEVEGAAHAARLLGLDHVVERFDESFASALAGVAGSFDGPFADSSAIATLSIARRARQRVTVVLSGTGGDDLFAGYYRHRADLLTRAIAVVPAAVRRRVAATRPARAHERGAYGTLMRSYLARLAAASEGDAVDRYLALVTGQASSAGAVLESASDPADVARGVADRIPFDQLGGMLRAVQRFEAQTYLPYDLLVKEDRATMACGLESRVPLLDPEVLACAERLPDRAKRDLRSGKKPLRRIAERRFGPAGFKRGFAVPLGALFDGAWHSEAIDWLESCDSACFDAPDAARALRDDELPAPDAWALAALAAWERRLSRERLARPRRAAA